LILVPKFHWHVRLIDKIFKGVTMFPRFFSGEKNKFFLDGQNAGVSLAEALVSVAVLGILAVGVNSVFSGSFKQYRMNKERLERSNVANYLLQYADCPMTAADPNFDTACASNQPVDIKDAQGNVILSAATGRTFDDYLTVTNTCSDGAIMFTAHTTKDPAKKSMMGGVPLVCKSTPPLCSSIVAERMGSPNEESCRVEIKKGEGITSTPTVLLGGVVQTTGVWSGDGSTWAGTVPCDVAGTTITGALRNAVADFTCGDATVEPADVAPTGLSCKLRLIQGDLAYWTAAVEHRPEMVVKVTSGETLSVAPKVELIASAVPPGSPGTWSYVTTPFKGCPDPPCWRGVFTGRKVWEPGRFKVSIEDTSTPKVTGSCEAFNYSCWDTTWRTGPQAYWEARPLIRAFATSNGKVIPANPTGNPGDMVAFHGPTHRKLCEWAGLKVMFASTLSSENRENYSSCGNNQHLQWNGLNFVSVPACSQKWTGCLLCN
jgi:Tfp pilus assembly protein PilV